ncbi:hypothetical protein PLCT2_00574 [Planctomycetaceae bacterium]|nr:hypothetical protein PLCT2_00574 [Planctomycetaceae bacterium]
MNESNRAVIYARVATDDLNGSELPAQIETCRQYADQLGFTVAEDHIVAEVYSGIMLR